MSDNAKVGGAITAIYRRNMGTIIERWERHITAAGPDVAPGVPEEDVTGRMRSDRSSSVRCLAGCNYGGNGGRVLIMAAMAAAQLN